MFSLEVEFDDGSKESLYIRRHQAQIGPDDYSYVSIPEMADLGFQLKLIRRTGRGFYIDAVPLNSATAIPHGIRGEYEGSTVLDLRIIKLGIVALDVDLMVQEPVNVTKILRTAIELPSPAFPAICLQSTPLTIISLPVRGKTLVGRGRECVVRVDSAEVSSRHAEVGFVNGKFWIEDVGSTNGTYINNHQVTGRVPFDPGVPVVIGKEISLYGVTSETQLRALENDKAISSEPVVETSHQYPMLITLSPVARPARITLVEGSAIIIGRDSNSDLWLGSPHVSRQHCQVELINSKTVRITDNSTNGTAYDDGILKKGQHLDLQNKPITLHFGQGVTVGVCFSLMDEEAFRSHKGSPTTFKEAQKEKNESFLENNSSGDLEEEILEDGTIKISHSQRMGILGEMVSLYDRLPPLQRTMVTLVALILAVLIGAVLLLVINIVI